MVRQARLHLAQVVHGGRLHGERGRQEGRGGRQVGQRAAAHGRGRLLQRPALRRHHQRPLHAGPALLAGQQQVPGRPRDRQRPLGNEHAGRAHGVRGAALPADGARDRPHRPRGHEAHAGEGGRGQRRPLPVAAPGHEVPAEAPLHRRRLRGAPQERRRHRGAPAEGLQGGHGELGRRGLRAHLGHQLRHHAARHDPPAALHRLLHRPGRRPAHRPHGRCGRRAAGLGPDRAGPASAPRST